MSVTVEVITAPGCSKCVTAKEAITRVLKTQKGVAYKETSLIDHPDAASKYRIMSTPAIIINGKLEFEGNPGEKKLRKKLEEYNVL